MDLTLGAGIFLSVVLLLVTFHKPFRKFFLWAAGAAVIGCALFFGYVYVQEWRQHRHDAAALVAPVANEPLDLSAGLVPKDPTDRIIEIEGGETLDVKKDPYTKYGGSIAPVEGFVEGSEVPVVYLGHNQKIVVACGDKKYPTLAKQDKKGTIVCR